MVGGGYVADRALFLDERGRIFELYVIKSTERNGRAPLDGATLPKSKKVFDNSKVTDHHAIIWLWGDRRP